VLEAFEDVGLYLADSAVPVVLSVIASVLVTRATQRGAIPSSVVEHDRLADWRNEDLERWVRDRDREARARMDQVAQDIRQRGLEGGALDASAGRVYRAALHELRDQLSTRARELDEALAREGRGHARYRRRKGQHRPQLRLPPECRNIVAEWKQRAEEDPTSAEREPGLQRILEDQPNGPGG